MCWDSRNQFTLAVNNLVDFDQERKSAVKQTSTKILGSRPHPETWSDTNADNVPTHDELRHWSAARRVTDAPRQVAHQHSTSRQQFSIPACAVSHSKPELAQIDAQQQLKQLKNDLPVEQALLNNAKALFQAQILDGSWFQNLNQDQKEQFQSGRIQLLT